MFSRHNKIIYLTKGISWVGSYEHKRWQSQTHHRQHPSRSHFYPFSKLSIKLRINLTLCTFCTAFWGYFRIGELVQDSKEQPGDAKEVEDVMLTTSNAVIITLRHSKTGQEGKGAKIILVICPICPIQHNMIVTQLWLTAPGAFFIHFSCCSVTGY